jgi:hypothetical protein
VNGKTEASIESKLIEGLILAAMMRAAAGDGVGVVLAGLSEGA